MKQISQSDLNDLAIGAAILGSGGGGDTEYQRMMASHVMDKWGSTTMISLNELKPDDEVILIGICGAPLAEFEKIASGRELKKMVDVFESTLKKKVTAIMPYEIGGGNAFSPFLIAPILGIPVVDADTMGRAFPEIQMSTCAIFGAPCSPGVFIDCLGNSVVIHANDFHTLEKIGRKVAVAMGSWAFVGLCSLTGMEAKDMTISKSISKAISLGKLYRESKLRGEDPVHSILKACKGTLIGTGKIVDIDRVISQGFLKGSAVIQNKNDKIEMFYQNEFLLAKVNGKAVGTTPDILSLLEVDTGHPITTESLRYGIRVNLIAIPSTKLWTTPKGLNLVGPRYFGYEIDYLPCNQACKKSHFATEVNA